MKRQQTRDTNTSSKRFRASVSEYSDRDIDRMSSEYYRESRAVSSKSGVGVTVRGRNADRDFGAYRDFDRGQQRRYAKDDRYADYYDVQQTRDRSVSAVAAGTKEDYRTLCLSNLNPRIQDKTITEAIHQEFRKFGDFNIKLVQVGPERRIAYVNFRYPEDARDAKYARENKLVLFDMPVRIDAVYPKKRFGDSPEGLGRDSFSGKDVAQKSRHGERRDVSSGDRDRDYHGYGENRPQREGHKFPHHLHHIQPEDDDKATRTLFVGNLEVTITEEELRRVFERYGIVEDVDIKRPTKGQGNAYAFIRFQNLDMAHRAKVDMSGRYIGKLQCKIGYGKVTPTNCLWIGGLGPWVSTNLLEAEFDRFGVIRKIYWNESNNYAFVLYDSQDAALAASKEMRGFPLGGQDRRLRIDFADPESVDLALYQKLNSRAVSVDRTKREAGEWHSKGYYPDDKVDRDQSARAAEYRTSDSDYYKSRRDDVDGIEVDRWKYSRSYRDNDDVYRTRQSQGYGHGYTPPRDQDRASPDAKRQRIYDRDAQRDYYNRGHNTNGNYTGDVQHSDSSLFNVDGVINAQTIEDLAKGLPVVWSGALVLKNSAFSTRMHLVDGNLQLVDMLMRDQTTTEMSLLKITQRLRLDRPKLDDMARRVMSSAPNGYSILLAMPGSDSALEDANTKVQHRPLKNLVSYLKQKEAAGVISLPPNAGKDQELGVLHAFPPCQFGHNYLLKRAPRLSTDTGKDDHLVVVVVGGCA